MKNQNGYTKGPWTYVANRVVGQGKTVADVRFKNGDNDGPLLAAAPELLEACKDAAILLEEMGHKDLVTAIDLRAVISKAEGK